MGLLDDLQESFGKLDFDKLSVNPIANIGLGLLMNQRQPTGMPTGQVLGQGVMQGLGNMGQMQQMQMKQAEAAQKMAESKRLQDLAKRRQDYISQLPENVQRMAVLAGDQFFAPVKLGEGDVLNIPALSYMGNGEPIATGGNKIKEGYTPEGRKTFGYYGKDGFTPVGGTEARPLSWQGLGNRHVGLDPITGKEMISYAAGMEPGARARLNFEMNPTQQQMVEGARTTGREAAKLPFVAPTVTATKTAEAPFIQTEAENKAFGQAKGEGQAKAQMALPTAIVNVETGLGVIDQMIGKRDASGKLKMEAGNKVHPGFNTYVGATAAPGLRFIEGSDTASYEALHKQLEGQGFLDAFEALKGGGAITEIEGTKATKARLRMNKAQSKEEYVKAALEYRAVLQKGLENARKKAAGASSSGATGNWTDL